MPASPGERTFLSSGGVAFLAVVAFVLGFQGSGDFRAATSQSEVEFLTDLESSVREVITTESANGHRWVCWLSQSASEPVDDATLMLQVLRADGTTATAELATGSSIGPATIASLPDGGAMVVWESLPGAGSTSKRVFRGRTASATQHEGQGVAIALGDTELVPTAADKPLLPHLAELANGQLGLVWQESLAKRHRAFFMRRDESGSWSSPKSIAPQLNGDLWRPRVAGSADGRVLIAFDYFEGNTNNSFDVWVAVAPSADATFELIEVAGGPTYQGYPELAVDDGNRAWIVYEEAPSFGQGGPLRSFRRTRLASITEDGSVQHAALPGSLGEQVRGDFPKLLVTAEGIVISQRRPRNDYVPRNPSMQSFYATWSTHLIGFDADGNPSELQLESSDGGNDNDSSLVTGPDGIEIFWATDSRSKNFPQRFGFDSAIEEKWRLAKAGLDVPIGFPKLQETASPPMTLAWQGPAPPANRIVNTPGVVYGDLHRHTDLSRCAGRKDGILLDAVRYAFGPGALGFMAITDHYQHLTPWSYWRQLRDIERWDTPGRLALLPGLERMVTKLGHQNLVFADLQQAREAGRETTPENLTGDTVVSIPHMTSTPRNPFDWKLLDPTIHRAIEVHQGRRGSFEGLPSGAETPAANVTGTGQVIWPHAAFPAQAKVGWLSRLPAALAADAIPPGLISSSDHASSGTGFAGLFMLESGPAAITRDAVFAGLAARRTFASTGRDSLTGRNHFVSLAVEEATDGSDDLVIQADQPGLVGVTVFENGAVWLEETTLLTEQARRRLLIRTHFGKGSAWSFAITPRGLAFDSPALRQPRVDLFGPPTINPNGSITLEFPADVSYDADVDLLLDASVVEGPQQSIEFELQTANKAGAKLSAKLDLTSLSGPFARRFWLQKPKQKPYFDVVSLGEPLVDAQASAPAAVFELRQPLHERPQGAIYYVRVAWSDGNFAWSRLVRR